MEHQCRYGEPMTVSEYLRTPETTRRIELINGMVREPAAPARRHQDIAVAIWRHLHNHVRRHALGYVGMSPIDVILDRHAAVVVQPDVLFVAAERAPHIVRRRVWGAPDLAVEVTSQGTGRFDRRDKRTLYREHGVAEYWLADPCLGEVTVEHFATQQVRCFEPGSVVRSLVLPRLRLPVARIFDAGPFY